MQRVINVRILLAILAALVLIGAAAFRIDHNTRRQADLTQQTIDEQKRFAEQVEALKKQRR